MNKLMTRFINWIIEFFGLDIYEVNETQIIYNLKKTRSELWKSLRLHQERIKCLEADKQDIDRYFILVPKKAGETDGDKQ